MPMLIFTQAYFKEIGIPVDLFTPLFGYIKNFWMVSSLTEQQVITKYFDQHRIILGQNPENYNVSINIDKTWRNFLPVIIGLVIF